MMGICDTLRAGLVDGEGTAMPDCAGALAALRNAEGAWNAAHDELQQAAAAAAAADRALAAAEKAFNDASLAADRALKAWSDFIDALKKDPTLGVPGIDAGTAPSADKVPAGASSGLVRDPSGAVLLLWGRSDRRATLDAWTTALLKAMGTYNVLSSTSIAASAAALTARAARDRARADADAAHKRLDAARAADKTADAAYDAALAAARAACGSDPAQTTTGNGVTVGTDPLVPPDRRKKLIDVIDLLKPKEVKGMKVIQHYDHPANKDAFAVWEPSDNTVHLYDSCARARIVKHEVGHWVYHNRVLPADQQTWKDVWAKNKANMPSSIARDDDDQGFAECYERLRDNEPLDPDIKKAIAKIVENIT